MADIELRVPQAILEAEQSELPFCAMRQYSELFSNAQYSLGNG